MSTFEPARRLRGVQVSPIRHFFDGAPPGSINLGLGEPDFPTPEVICREASRVVLEEHNPYTMHAGLPALRQKVAAGYPFLENRAERVLITAGSQEALFLSLMSLVNEGDEVLLPDPGFVAYPAIVRMAGGTPTYYRLPASTNFGFDAEDFSRKLTPKTKVVVSISPSNPTGRALSAEDMNSMAGALDGHSAYLISDEIYRDLYFGEERPGTISDRYSRTLVIGGLSKSLSMTGWRLGWLCASEEVINAARLLHGYVVTCASTVSQKAALVAWGNEAQAAQCRMRETLRRRRDFLLQLVAEELGLRCVVPDGAFYCMMDVRACGPSWQVAEAILKGGVITVPGVAFGPGGEGFLRLSFSADLPILREGVERMRAVLASFQPTN